MKSEPITIILFGRAVCKRLKKDVFKIMPIISLKQQKNDTLSKEIKALPPPKTAYVPLCSSRRENLVATVSVGDTVTPFVTLSQPESGKGSPVNSPFFGKVISIKKFVIPAVGKLPCAEIEVKNTAEQHPDRETAKPEDFSKEEIMDACMRAGIVDELDGRRLWEKLAEASRSGLAAVAVDAVEDDLYSSAGLCVLMNYGGEVAKGLILAGIAANLAERFIAVYSDKSWDEKINESYGGLPVRRFEGKYPQNHKLRKDLDAKGGGIAIGPQAARALYRAVTQNEMQTHTIVTVAGDCVLRSGNYLVPVGMPVGELLYHAGASEQAQLILAGGYIRGIPVTQDTPVYQGLTAVIAVREADKKASVPCIGCGSCASVCPVGLMPNYILEQLAGGHYSMVGGDAIGCIGCGLCTLVCPSKIYVSAGVAKVKKEILELNKFHMEERSDVYGKR
ncbi:MAG TPA: hypothetical protein DEQ02_04730 [Ruminococcaceae bacterium]|nr:hypothetical protein [Oscillospiraceae bacterium]